MGPYRREGKRQLVWRLALIAASFAGYELSRVFMSVLDISNPASLS